MTECYCLQFLDLDWTTFCTTSLAVLEVLDLELVHLVVPAVDLVVPAVDLVAPAVDLVVPAVDLEGVLVVPAVDLEALVEVLVDLIPVMVAAVDMGDMV